MNAINPLYLVQTINTLLTLVQQFGLTWQQVSAAVEKAQAEGRQFGMQDVKVFREQAAANLAALDEAIAKAQS